MSTRGRGHRTGKRGCRLAFDPSSSFEINQQGTTSTRYAEVVAVIKSPHDTRPHDTMTTLLLLQWHTVVPSASTPAVVATVLSDRFQLYKLQSLALASALRLPFRTARRVAAVP